MKRHPRNVFYVYEHWRPDRNVCFWVGKGYGSRAYKFKRNEHYNHVVVKLARLGMCVEVRMVENGLPEREALSLEQTRIAYWRAHGGDHLTNMTGGGEGTSGIVYSPARRRRISVASKGRRLSKEARAKIRKAALNRSPEYWARVSRTKKGKKLSEEHKRKLSLAHKGKRCPTRQRELMRKLFTGRHVSDETRAKTSASIKAWHASRRLPELQ